MQPAYSVIFFTAFSGLGFGMVMVAGALALAGYLVPDPAFALVTMALALGTAAAGLMSSALHLGHPERAWRAFSQWRTSWLSREGVLSISVFPPAVLFALGWAFGGLAAPWTWAGALAALLAFATVIATGMIYQSLPTIRAWAQPLVTPGYIVLALASGSLWLAVLARVFGLDNTLIDTLPIATLIVAWAVKASYWWGLDRLAPGPTPASATGLGGSETNVRLLEAPHTQENFVMREMGYRVARRHARRLRFWAQALAFLLPLVMTAFALSVPERSAIGLAAMVIAGSSAMLGILIERWLFFAEARHVVTLYYGAPQV